MSVEVNVTVIDGSDDCYVFLYPIPDTMRLDRNYLFLGSLTVNGVRFQSVNVPKGATIEAAYITFQAYTNDTDDIDDLYVYGEDVDDAAAYSTVANFNGRDRTTAKVLWEPGTWITDEDYNTPDITDVVQEIINRDGWVANQDMAFFIQHEGSSHNSRRPKSYEYSTTWCARLYIKYVVEGVTHEWEGSDGITIGEALVKTPMKVLVDSFQFSDVLVKEFYKTLTDPIAFTDTWEGYKLLAKILTDGIAIGEALVKSTSKVISDGVAIGEALVKQTEKVLSDGVAIGEALVKQAEKTFTDAIAFTDTLARHFEKVLSDGIAFTDKLCTIFVGKIIRTLDAVRNNVAVRIVSKIRDCWFR